MTTTTDTTATTEATGTGRAVEQIVLRDPKALASHPSNVRRDLGDVSDLAKSIVQVGVLEPIVLVPTDDGGEAILAGHRRTAAAIEAGCTEVPCIVRSDLSSGVESVTAMLVENLRRKDLTAIEEACAYEQLAGFGLSAAAIAKRTGSRSKQVKESLVVAGSEQAVAAGERYGFLNFEHLLALAEFEDDPEAVKELTVTARNDPGYFEHRASQLRQARLFEQKRAATTAALTEVGISVVDEPGYSERGPMRRLRDLVTDKGKELTEKSHASCEGHVATISSYNPEQVSYWCADPSRYGHKDRYASTPRQASSTERGEDGKLTEEARSERRTIIANNKAMDAANPVRREFATNLIARKAVPKGALRFAVRDLAEHPESVTPLDDALLAGFLGVEVAAREHQRTTGPRAVDQAAENRLVHVLLAHSAASIETTWTKEAWRSVDPRKAAWLSFLVTAGYRLAEVEQLVIDQAAAKGARPGRLRVVAANDRPQSEATEQVDSGDADVESGDDESA